MGITDALITGASGLVGVVVGALCHWRIQNVIIRKQLDQSERQARREAFVDLLLAMRHLFWMVEERTKLVATYKGSVTPNPLLPSERREVALACLRVELAHAKHKSICTDKSLADAGDRLVSECRKIEESVDWQKQLHEWNDREALGQMAKSLRTEYVDAEKLIQSSPAESPATSTPTR